ncbi:MAG: SpaA isopeptide-forming pilin-related protein [Eubacterium sp.]
MGKFKKFCKQLVVFTLILAMFVGLCNGLQFNSTNVDAADTNYFDVEIYLMSDPNNYSTAVLKGTVTFRVDSLVADENTPAKFPAYTVSSSGSTFGTKLKRNSEQMAISGNNSNNTGGNYKIVSIPLSIDLPPHYSFIGFQRKGEIYLANSRFTMYDKIVTNTSEGKSYYWDFTKRHNGSGSTSTEDFYVGINKSNILNHSGQGMKIYLYAESYKVNYNLGTGGLFPLGYDKTITSGYARNPLNNAVSNGDMFYVDYPIKTGYTFNGWTASGLTSVGGSTPQCYTDYGWEDFNGKKKAHYFYCLSPLGGTVTLIADWTENQYNVTLNGNGYKTAAGAETYSAGSFKYESEKVSLSGFSQNTFISPTEYILKGWSRNKYAKPDDTDVYSTEAELNKLSSVNGDNVTLYAIWEKNETLLKQPNALLNTQKHMEVLIAKVGDNDASKTYNANFAVFPWSASQGKYLTDPVKTISANKRYELEFTADNQGKFKIKEVSVDKPLVMTGTEFTVSLDDKDCKELPFYENKYVDEDMGCFVSGRGYEAGEIVRNTKAVSSNTKFYLAKRAVPGKDSTNNTIALTNTNYWQEITSGNYSNYSRLIAGAGEWESSSYSYAVAFSKEVSNPSHGYDSLVFGLQKNDPSGTPLSGAEFNAYYADEPDVVCRELNEYAFLAGLYGSNINKDGVEPSDRSLRIPIDEKWEDIDENTKTLDLIVREDNPPEGFKKIDDFRVHAIAEYNEEEDMWLVKSIQALTLDGRTILQTINNQETFDFAKLTDEPYKVDITINKHGKEGLYPESYLLGAKYVIYEDESLTHPVGEPLVIDGNGTVTVTGLPLKDYWVQEQETPDSGYFLYDGTVYKISKEDILKGSAGVDLEKEPAKKTIDVYEPEVKGYVTVRKEDLEGNEVNGAKFSLFKWDSSIEEDSLEDYTWDVKNAVATETVKEGYAKFSDLPLGKYVLVETFVPDKWEKAPSQIIEVTLDNTSEETAATTSVFEKHEECKLKIYKKDKSDESKNLEGAAFKIYDVEAKQYITQNSSSYGQDGSVSSTKEEKLFFTDENGFVETDEGDLEFDKTYRVEEVIPPAGYLLDPTPKEFTTIKEESEGKDKDNLYYFSVTFKDDKTEIPFEKRDIMTSDEIEGGYYVVTKDEKYYEVSEGEKDTNIIVDEWTGTGKPHKVYGLVAGETYYFNELIAPDGYTLAQSIEFTVSEDGKSILINGENSNIVTMYDDYNKVELLKVDAKTGKPLANAKMELHKGKIPEGKSYEEWLKEDTPIASWTSTTEAYRIDRLSVGTYTWVETEAPKGYVLSAPKIIEIDESTEVQEFEFENECTKTQFIKLSAITGEPLKGCTLQILDENKKLAYSPNGEAIEWVTDGEPHEVYYLEEGKTYYLHEKDAPSNFYLAEDVKFVAGQSWKDENIKFSNDEFIYPEDELETVPGEDERYGILQGDKVQILDENKNVVEEFTFIGKYYVTTKLVNGNTYYLHNVSAPSGYELFEDVKFIAGEDWDYSRYIVIGNEEDEYENIDYADSIDWDYTGADIVTIYMMNQPKLISIVKKNSEGDFVNKAEIQLLDSDRNVIDSWLSDLEVARVYNLSNGTYYIHEVYAPGDYDLTKDVEFEVTDDTKEVEYEMIDEYIGGTIKIEKKDEDTLKPIEGVEYTLVGELINDKTITITAKTDKNGEIVFGLDKETGKGTLIPGHYTITETAAEGHTLLKDPIEVDLSVKLTKAEAAAQNADTSKAKWDKDDEVYRFFDLTYEVTNAAVLKLPTTGSNVILYAVIAGTVMFLLAGLYLGLKKRKTKVE